jgi:hypothetical protein
VCYTCPSGKTSSSGGTECFDSPDVLSNIILGCAAGKILNSDTGKCEACEKGSFSDGSTMTQCKPCPENQYSSLSGSTACFSCPDGKASSVGSFQCYDGEPTAWDKYGVPIIATLVPSLFLGAGGYMFKIYMAKKPDA